MCSFFKSPGNSSERKGQSLITQDQIRKITELVKPLKDQLAKRLNEDEMYKAYIEDVRVLNATKNFEDKS